MARVHTVSACRKPQGKCGRCGDEIKKGDGYRFAAPGFRAPRKIRCLKSSCYFRQSELTNSNMSTAYAAIESAEDDIASCESVEDIKSALSTAAEGLRETAQMYEEANTAWGETNGAENYEWTEKRDQLESAADEADSWDPSVSDPQADVEDDTDNPQDDEMETYLEDVRQEAIEFIGGLDIG